MTGDHSHRPEPLLGSDTHSQEPILRNTSKYGIFQKLQHGTICSDGSWSREHKLFYQGTTWQVLESDCISAPYGLGLSRSV